MKNIYKYIFVALVGLVAVQGICRADGEGDISNIKLFKKTVPIADEEDMYLITLDSYVTGTTTVTSVIKPVDIVLVLDVSTSMSVSQSEGAFKLKSYVPLFTGDKVEYLHTDYSEGHNKYNDYNGYKVALASSPNTQRNMRYNNGKWQYYQNGSWEEYTGSANDQIYTCVKIDLLEEATRNFVKQIEQSAAGPDGKLGTTDDVDHRIGFATFCGNLTQWVDITPVHTLGSATTVQVHDGNQNAGVARTVTIEEFINDLYKHQGGSTGPHKAFDQAAREFDKLNTVLNGEVTAGTMTAEERANRAKVSLMFTDGKPQDNGVTLNLILENTHTLKSTYSAKVFTVGIFDFNDETETFDGRTIKQYMEYSSSYYPDCTDKDHPGTRNNDGVKYYQKSDGSNLSAIFQSIAESASAETYELTASDAAAVDVMSTDFELPTGMTAANVTCTQWVFTGPSELPDGDYTSANKLVEKPTDVVAYKVRGSYTFVPYKPETTDSDKIYDGDAPTVILDQQDGHDRVIVNGFWYSKDDDLKTDKDGKYVTDKNGKFVIADNGTYGNWVGVHQDGKNAGKMLEFTFKVHLKASSMGGFSLPSNQNSSGIYKNTAAPGEDPEYTLLVTPYVVPLVDVPSIIIIKEGLRYGDSALFTLERMTDAEGNTLTSASAGYMKYTVSLTQDNEDGGMCFLVIKDLQGGDYKVTEQTNWSWAYTPDTNFITSQTYNLHTPDLGTLTAEQFKADVASRQTAATYGQTNDMATRKLEKNLYYVKGMGVSADDEPEGKYDGMHLLFKFKNAYSNPQILHDEAMTVNVFGEGGGSSEHGGEDPEEEATGYGE